MTLQRDSALARFMRQFRGRGLIPLPPGIPDALRSAFRALLESLETAWEEHEELYDEVVSYSDDEKLKDAVADDANQWDDLWWEVYSELVLLPVDSHRPATKADHDLQKRVKDFLDRDQALWEAIRHAHFTSQPSESKSDPRGALATGDSGGKAGLGSARPDPGLGATATRPGTYGDPGGPGVLPNVPSFGGSRGGGAGSGGIGPGSFGFGGQFGAGGFGQVGPGGFGQGFGPSGFGRGLGGPGGGPSGGSSGPGVGGGGHSGGGAYSGGSGYSDPQGWQQFGGGGAGHFGSDPGAGPTTPTPTGADPEHTSGSDFRSEVGGGQAGAWGDTAGSTAGASVGGDANAGASALGAQAGQSLAQPDNSSARAGGDTSAPGAAPGVGAPTPPPNPPDPSSTETGGEAVPTSGNGGNMPDPDSSDSGGGEGPSFTPGFHFTPHGGNTGGRGAPDPIDVSWSAEGRGDPFSTLIAGSGGGGGGDDWGGNNPRFDPAELADPETSGSYRRGHDYKPDPESTGPSNPHARNFGTKAFNASRYIGVSAAARLAQNLARFR